MSPAHALTCVGLLRLLASLPSDRMSGPCHSYPPAVVSEPPHPHLHSLSAAAAALRKAGSHSKTPALTFSSTSQPRSLKPSASRNPADGWFSLLFASETESRGSFLFCICFKEVSYAQSGSDVKYQRGEMSFG